MSKRMSLVEATTKRKDEFVRAAVAMPLEENWPDKREPVETSPVPSALAPRSTQASQVATAEAQRKKTTFNIDAALHRRLKLTAVRQEREMVDIVEEALVTHLRAIDRGVGGLD